MQFRIQKVFRYISIFVHYFYKGMRDFITSCLLPWTMKSFQTRVSLYFTTLSFFSTSRNPSFYRTIGKFPSSTPLVDPSGFSLNIFYCSNNSNGVGLQVRTTPLTAPTPPSTPTYNLRYNSNMENNH